MVPTPRGGVANRVVAEIYGDWIAPRVQVLVLLGNVISTAHQRNMFWTKCLPCFRLRCQMFCLYETVRVFFFFLRELFYQFVFFLHVFAHHPSVACYFSSLFISKKLFSYQVLCTTIYICNRHRLDSFLFNDRQNRASMHQAARRLVLPLKRKSVC